MNLFKMLKPTEDQLNTAIEWLLHNEGGEGESEACHTVASWLSSLIIDQDIKNFAKKSGIPVKQLRKAVNEKMKNEEGKA